MGRHAKLESEEQQVVVPELRTHEQGLVGEFRSHPRPLQVSSTGHGLDVKEAAEDAFQDAVRQALGSIRTSETLVTQGDKLDENVVILGNGFVQEYKVQGQPSVRSGIVSVTIAATATHDWAPRQFAPEFTPTTYNSCTLGSFTDNCMTAGQAGVDPRRST